MIFDFNLYVDCVDGAKDIYQICPEDRARLATRLVIHVYHKVLKIVLLLKKCAQLLKKRDFLDE